MAKHTESIAASEATTLVNNDARMPEQRTTLTGKPLKYQHDSSTNMMLSEGGFAVGNAGANLLPHGYTDKSLVRIPIKMSDVEGEAAKGTDPIKQPKKGGFFRKLSGAMSDKTGGEEIKMVSMSRGDYLKYWAKGDDGNFLPDVVEPPEGRKEWFRKQVLLNEEMKKDTPSARK